MENEEKLRKIMFENNVKLQGVKEILTDMIMSDDNHRSSTLYCVVDIIESVIKSQDVDI